eukprot:COSAG05_NODE_1345_length_5128_cov_2.221316_3_plen_1405_part_00
MILGDFTGRWNTAAKVNQLLRGLSGRRLFTNMQETWNICNRFWEADLSIRHYVSPGRERLYILVGAADEVLREEAELMQLPVRIQTCRGMTEFRKDFTDYYVVAMDGSLFNSAQRQKIVQHRMERSLLLTLREQQSLGQPSKQLQRLKRRLMEAKPIRAELVRKLLAACGAFRDNASELLGPTVEKAVLQSSADQFFCVYPPEVNTDLNNPLGAIIDVGDQVAKMGQDTAKFAIKSFIKLQRQARGAKRVLVGKAEMERRMKRRYKELGLVALTYEDCEQLAVDIEAWLEGVGSTERFTGSLNAFFPTHDPHELLFFKKRWANGNLIKRMFIEAKDNEGKSTQGAYYCDDPSLVGALKKNQWAYGYQPIDEIRDYFGDSIALYFCWLGLYVQSLVLPSVVGLLVNLSNVWRGDLDPDTNQLTLAYSLFFAAWAVSFLSQWERKEYELRFLWGTENIVESQKPRPQYKGVLRVNFTTSREVLVDKSPAKRFFRQCMSWLVIIMVMVFTAMLALWAELLSKKGDTRVENSCEPAPGVLDAFSKSVCNDASLSSLACSNAGINEHGRSFNCTFGTYTHEIDSLADIERFYFPIIVSATLNLIIMFVMGQLFSPLALALNDWENHKLQTTYDNHLVFKNFVFEFVNNYFIMFYIAYLRQIKDPISGKVAPCPRSCMAELQLKMLFVFTGKTMGLKLGEYGIPWIKSFWKTREDQKRTTRHRQMTQLGADIGGMGKSSDGLNPANSGELGDMEAVGKRQDCAGDNLHDLDGTVLTDVEWLDKQYFLADFDGTFDDFSQMAIQFGFLALFAPACPIAPLLALINNVTEIRTDAYKVVNMGRRPEWTTCHTIGAWKDVLKTLSVVAVVTNATMICFVGSQMVDGWYSDGENHDFLKERMTNRFTSARLWIITVLIEHGVMVLKTAIGALSPTQPRWVHDARDVLEYRKKNFKTSAELNKESLRLFKKHKETDPYTLFEELDADGSGALDSEEIRKLCHALGLKLGKHDLLATMKEMDGNGDGQISFSEFNAWWELNGKQAHKNAYQMRDTKAMFAQLDIDGNGMLDQNELRSLCRMLGMEKMKDKHVTQLMEELDTDGDGTVSFEEFDVWWKENGGKKYRKSIDAPTLAGTDKRGTIVSHLESKDLKRSQAKRKNEIAETGIVGMLKSVSASVTDALTEQASPSTASLGGEGRRSALIRAIETPDTPTTPPNLSPNSFDLQMSPNSALPGWAAMGSNQARSTNTQAGAPSSNIVVTSNPLLGGGGGTANDTAPVVARAGAADALRVLSSTTSRQVLDWRFTREAPLGLWFEEDWIGTDKEKRRVVKVIRLDHGSQAWETGLAAGVVVERVDGVDVSTLSIEQVYALLARRPIVVTFSQDAGSSVDRPYLEPEPELEHEPAGRRSGSILAPS